MNSLKPINLEADVLDQFANQSDIIEQLRRYEDGLKGKRLKTFKAAYQRARESNGVRASFMIARMSVEEG